MIKTRILVLIILLILLALVTSISNPLPKPEISASQSSETSVSDGILKISYAPEVWSLAVKPEQILVAAYIPPCTGDFNYCLYIMGDEYKGTNFESGGLSFSKRADLTSESLCLETPPRGFTSAVKYDKTKSTDIYSSSIFGNVSGAAAGHYSNGGLYRLFIKKSSTCYELESRIAMSRFENYPEGTISEFTPDMAEKIKTQIDELINDLSLETGDSHLFP